jgi:hypothetical protein
MTARAHFTIFLYTPHFQENNINFIIVNIILIKVKFNALFKQMQYEEKILHSNLHLFCSAFLLSKTTGLPGMVHKTI